MANRYWVGGSGSWSSTAKWSSTSGGTGGSSVPTSADDVFIDNNSFLPAGSFSITVVSSMSVRNFTVTRTNGSVQWNSTISPNTLNINGDLSVNSSITYLYSYINFVGTTLTTAYMATGNTWDIQINKSSGGGVTLLSSFSTYSYNPSAYGVLPLNLTQGSLDLNGYNITCSNFVSSNSNTRSIRFGGGNIILGLVYSPTPNLNLIFSMSNATNFTNVDDGGYFVLQGSSPSIIDVYVPDNGTDSNTVSFHINSNEVYRFSDSGLIGFYPVTISGLKLSTGRITTPDVSNTGSFPPFLELYGNLVIEGSPTTSTNIRLVSSTKNQTISGGAGTLLRQTRSWSYQTGGMTISVTLRPSLFVVKGAGTYANLNQNLTLSNMTFGLSSGGLNTNNYTVSVGAFFSSSTTARELNMGTSDWIISASDSNLKYWDITTSTNLTLTFDPSNQASISMSSTGSQSFQGGSLSYPELIITTASSINIYGNNEFVDISNTAQPCTVTFAALSTNTFDNFSLSGTSGNLVTINSSGAFASYYLQTNGNDVNVSFCSITRSFANNLDVNWNAFVINGNVNGGNNDGWRFYEVEGGAFMAFF